MQPNLRQLIQIFLHTQLRADSLPSLFSSDSDSESDHNLPDFNNTISVYNSAVATYYAPSDLSGVGGMHRERIRAVSSWRGEGPRRDCVFINTDPTKEGMQGLDIARVHLFFSFKYRDIFYPCALIHWYSRNGDEPDEDTGMWVVEPDFDPNGSPTMAIVHLDTILRAAHLIGVYGNFIIPRGIPCHYSLDIFHSYYVNKYVDHHAFEIAF